ncbi:MAG: hypothetical protein QOJ07_2037 [Thermoleophilaceae bacterium]|nr:hypothetical protein [Thermoleophilaceae bacterium]
MPAGAPYDVLVLGGGGILGEAWMFALLAGLEEATGWDARECDGFVGTSAGSIVAAALAGGVAPADRLGSMPEQPASDDAPAEASRRGAALLGGVLRLGRTATGLLAPVALRSTALGGAWVRRVALARVPRGKRSLSGLGDHVDRTGVRFDGRLRVSAVDLGSGRRVMFGAPDAPAASVGAAVEASCAIPGVFRPVAIGGRDYVDGGAWSPTNMDEAPAGRGSRVLCLNPTGSLRGSRAAPFAALGPVSRSVASVEALVLERRGAHVTSVSPDAASAAAMGINLMASGPRSRVREAGYAQGRALAGQVRAAA